MHAVVWFKRDLRWHDHAAWHAALESGMPIMLLFIVEPELVNHPTYSHRHWWFQFESIREIQTQFSHLNLKVNVLQGSVTKIFEDLLRHYGPFVLFSHEETGIGVTYERDRSVNRFAQSNQLTWHEFPQFAVQRGRKNRKGWDDDWDQFMNQKQLVLNVESGTYVRISSELRQKYKVTILPRVKQDNFQVPGRLEALRVLHSFVHDRHKRYSRSISKPVESRLYCSRLSPYLAWGNLSLREVVQALAKEYQKTKNPNFQAALSRLHWHCHFIQKMESEPEIEFVNQNKAYDVIRTTMNPKFFELFTHGRTGFPLIDACIRCLQETGYLNFRMRAMLVSFWTHHLFQPWQPLANWMGALFLDFEPGIHFAQFQMQAGTVGYHTIRVYNPVKQAEEHDPDATFIKCWLPELANLPQNFAREPWTMTAMEELFFDFKYGEDYPTRMIDLDNAAKHAREVLHALKASSAAKVQAAEIRKIHVK